MYALSVSNEGDFSRGVSPDPGIAAATLGASESGTLPGTTPPAALHTFTLDTGASACFFCDITTLTPLSTPLLVRLADPSGGPIMARSSTVLPCPTVPSGSLSGLHLPSFSANLVSTAALQDAMVTTTTPGGQRVTICTCTQTGHHLATFTRRPGSSLYTLATEPPQIAASAQVSTLGQVVASCSCRLLLHQTLLWHRRLGFPSLPRLRGMHSRLLRTAPHSSFRPTTAPVQTLHMDVWGLAYVSGQDRERYFLLVVDDYTRYTTVFPLRSKGQFVDVLIPWIRTVRLQLRERFGQDLPVLRQHSDRGVMEVARTSMIHAAAPHFLWPFAVRYAAHQLNLWPRVSLPETSRRLRWMGEVGDASVFRVWGSRAFVRDTSADKLSPRAIPCVFLGFVPDAPGWQFYHPTSRRVFPSLDITFDESVPFYRLFPCRSAPPPPPPLFLAPGPPLVDPLPPQGPSPSSVSRVDPLPGHAPVQVAVGLGPARGATSGGAASGSAEPGGVESEGVEIGGAEPGGVEPGGTELEGVELGGAASEGAESGGAEPQGAASSGGFAGASPRLSPQQLPERFVRRARLRSGASGAGGAGAAGAGGTGVAAGAGVPGGTATTGPGGARTRGTGAVGTGGVEGAGAGDPTESGTFGAGGAGAGGAGVGGTGTGGAGAGGDEAVDHGGAVRPRLYFVPLLQQVLGTPSSTGLTPPLLCRPLDKSQPPLQLASPLPAPSPYTEQSGGLTERHELAFRPVSPVRTARRAPGSRPPPVPGTHAMKIRPFSVPLHVPLPAPPESSLPAVPDPECDRARATSLIVSRLLATAVTDPSFESTSASALVGELLEFAAACRLDYATSLFAESESACPPSNRGECALTTDVLEDRQAAMDAEMASWKSTGTYVNEVPPPRANIVDGVWIFMVKRPPSSPPAFKARYDARGFSTQWSLRRPIYGLRQAPREWHDTLRTALAALGFAPATADPSMFLHTDTSLPPFYILVYIDDLVFATADTEALTLVKPELQKRHSCTDLGELHGPSALRLPVLLTQPTPLSTGHSLSAPPSDESVEPSGPYPELVGCLMSTRSSSVLRSSCEAEIYVGAMAAQELRWLTYLMTDLGQQPRSPPVLYVDNKNMIALCQEQRLEHGTKHIALRYVLSRELQQRGQLRLAYVATRANTADIFTKTLPPGDHQCFSTVLGLVPTLPHLLTA
ncbi:unnamed protein product [Closterium sp. NIES-54]